MFQSLDMHKRRRPDDLMPVRPDDPSDRTTLATRGAGLTGAHAADGGGDLRHGRHDLENGESVLQAGP